MNESNKTQEEPKPLPHEPSPASDDKPSLWKRRDFWAGVGIFFGLNGIFFILSNLVSNAPSGGGILALVVNLAILVYTARERPDIAAGMLYSVGFLFLLGICVGIFLIATCFQYFSS